MAKDSGRSPMNKPPMENKAIYMQVSNQVKRKDGAIRGTKFSAISNKTRSTMNTRV